MLVRAVVEDIVDSSPPKKPTTVTQPEVLAKGPSGSDVSVPGITYRANQWIERPSDLDVCRNESIFTDDPLRGSNLGYRLLRNLVTSVDRPPGLIGLIATQHMHDLMKVVASPIEFVEMYRYYQEQHHQTAANQQALETAPKNEKKALDGIRAAKKKDDAELKALKEITGKLEAIENEIKRLCSQLDVKAKVADQLPLLQKELDDAKGTIGLLEEKVQKIETDKPGIRQRAVTGWGKPDWAKVEAAFNKKAHELATGFEQQKFVDEDLFNAEPSKMILWWTLAS
uniref:Uncharacterized protein n=1 Tax=Chenopodium quinoa TaxID=63459 RepID=A0A803MN42_CHEQI